MRDHRAVDLLQVSPPAAAKVRRVDALRRAQGEEGILLHLALSCARAVLGGTYARPLPHGADVGGDVRLVRPARAVHIAVRCRAESEVGRHVPIAAVVPALKARPCEVRDLIAGVAARGELRHEKVIHLLGRLLRREVEPPCRLHRRERRPLLDGQSVDGEVLRREGDGRHDTAAQVVKGLPRQSVHEVDADILESCRARRVKCLRRLRGGVDAPDAAKERVVKALCAEAEAVRPRRAECAEVRRVHGAGIRLDTAFHRRSRRRAECLQQSREERRGQCRRRAAAHVDGRRRAPPCTKRRHFAQDLCRQRRRIVLHLRRMLRGRDGDEVAVCTFFHAIGDVDVDAPRLALCPACVSRQFSAPP